MNNFFTRHKWLSWRRAKNMFLRAAFVLVCFARVFANPPIVDTHNGPVAGTSQVSRNGTKYYAFFGIPFAKPPVQDLRFRDPEEAMPWSRPINLTSFPPACPQAGWDSNTVSGQEDCLYLNVFTPRARKDGNLAVLVWIYGGGYIVGESAMYGPDYFMDKPVVLVTFNYRLGALGFISFDEKGYEGNYGMKDQVAALRWVKRNIRNFGGNPGRVTIAGSSAGGANVNWHMYSEASKGLFHGVISQSGSALASWTEIPRHVASRKAEAFSTLAGCNYKKVEETIKCLRGVSSLQILKIQDKLEIWHGTPLSFAVVVESHHENAFITKSPTESEVLDPTIPWIVGVTSDEGATLVSGLLSNNGAELSSLNDNAINLIPIALRFEYYKTLQTYEKTLNATNMVLDYYFQGQPISVETFQHVKMLIADSCMIYASTESLLKYRGPKYFYVYSHVNEYSFAEFESNPIKENLGAVHCDDLISLFRTSYFPAELNTVDREVSETMVTLWTNFVIHGDPNVGTKSDAMVYWEPVTSFNFKYLNIDTRCELRHWNWQDRYFFWKNINTNAPPAFNYTKKLGTLSGVSVVIFLVVNYLISF